MVEDHEEHDPMTGLSPKPSQDENNNYNDYFQPCTSPDLAKTKSHITALIVGAGNRAHVYVRHRQIVVVAVAEPVQSKRDAFQKKFSIPDKAVFENWQEAAKQPQLADAVIIATPDRLHTGPALAFAELGYNILLEKPMAVSMSDCRTIARTVHGKGIIFAVCHVLRYMYAARQIKEIIESGQIGEVLHIDLTEPVGYWHFAHSFVRGNWGKQGDSTFSLLAKSCHDIDLLYWWINATTNPCTAISSFGSLQHFRKSRKPADAGASTRCFQCPVQDTCIYSAKRIYYDRGAQGSWGWPLNAVVITEDLEDLKTELDTGPYGRCVYECDNDVVDHQVVNLEFASGATASFKMVATSEKLCDRSIHVYGSLGEIRCPSLNDNKVTWIDFTQNGDNRVQVFEPQACVDTGDMSGHGGADYLFTQAFVDAVRNQQQSYIMTGSYESLLSHELVFLAEQSRQEKRVVYPQEELMDEEKFYVPSSQA